jgi:glycogen operon protein
MLSNGTPMFCAGDEFMDTRMGNNNPYNQDNAINYLDWDLQRTNRDIFRFFQRMIAFRKAHPSIARSHFWREDITWFGSTVKEVDLSPTGHTLAYWLRGASLHDADIYVMINSSPFAQPFRVHQGRPGQWLLVANTGLPSPLDIADPGHEEPLTSLDYLVGERSVVVLYRPFAVNPAAAQEIAAT